MKKNYQLHSMRPTPGAVGLVIDVLLIEDDYSYAELVKILLADTAELTCNVSCGATLAEGLRYLESDRNFDVVLLDLSLPDSTGIETLHTLLIAYPNINVIVLTGNSDRKQGIEAVSAGAQDFLIKGDFDPNQLAKSLRFSMERKQLIILRQKTEDLERSKELAEERARVREQVIANVSHELRTPMNAILGLSNTMNKDNFDEDQNECFENIQEASQILLSIINDILLTSSLQNGVVEINANPFDVALTIRRISEVLIPKAKAKGLELTYQTDSKLLNYLIGDKQKLSQVLYNLIGNAIKFTDTGSIAIKVFLRDLDKKKQCVIFEIHDTGDGIEAKELDEIFQAFSRIKKPGKNIEGTGLGLTITKQLIGQMGGEIQVSSIVGQGSVFSFTLFFEVAGELKHKILPTTEEKEPLPKKKPKKLMVVEDHLMNQLVIRRTLEKKWPKLKLFITKSGEEALEILSQQSVDMILMDLQLPGIDGYETTKQIKSKLSNLHENTPILALTAQPLIANDNNYRAAGMNDYILKPFDPKTLFEKIIEHLK